MKKYIQGFKRLRIGVILFFAAVSLFTSWWTLRIPVNNRIRSIMPDYICTLTVLEEYNENAVPNSEVWIEGLVLGDAEGIFENESRIILNNGFELRRAEDFGYGCDVITNTGGAGSVLSFTWDGGKNDSIKFWRQNFSGIISLDISFGDETVLQDKLDLFSDQPDDRLVYELPTPLNETLVPVQYVVIKWLVYILGGAVLFFIFTAAVIAAVAAAEKDKK